MPIGQQILLSPSLRGSGLKYAGDKHHRHRRPVSLFTREWIEIMIILYAILGVMSSPSLRGSGLKLFPTQLAYIVPCSLPLYEGVD